MAAGQSHAPAAAGEEHLPNPGTRDETPMTTAKRPSSGLRQNSRSIRAGIEHLLPDSLHPIAASPFIPWPWIAHRHRDLDVMDAEKSLVGFFSVAPAGCLFVSLPGTSWPPFFPLTP